MAVNNNQNDIALVDLTGDDEPNNNPVNYSNASVEAIGTTKLNMETFAFVWKLEDFPTLLGSKVVFSPIFQGGDHLKGNHSWQLIVCPNKVIDGEEYFSIFLTLESFGDFDDSPDKSIKARFQITVLKAGGRPSTKLGKISMESLEFRKSTVRGSTKFMLMSDLTAPSRRLLEENCITIHCRIWVEMEFKHNVLAGGAALAIFKDQRANKRKEEIAQDFGNLLKSSITGDIEVVSPYSTKRFVVHKAIMGARSPYVADLLKEMKEMKNICMESDEEVIEGVLEYIYTSNTAIVLKRAYDTYQLAHTLQLHELKETCELQLMKEIDVMNAAQLLVFANINNLSDLKTRAVNFIRLFKKEVRETEGFKEAEQEYPLLHLLLCTCSDD